MQIKTAILDDMLVTLGPQDSGCAVVLHRLSIRAGHQTDAENTRNYSQARKGAPAKARATPRVSNAPVKRHITMI